ncbi:type II secretion system protein GspM [Sphingorhabdus sp.]|jgi:general secretion pathway protein M|uniref:type II secretion system protein GspM n=1 Tax=Sphingorhabdus sp. TaxID=1902408 RepID=UPI0026064953|nr:type II secretion system protein GspM [Sphingorhabdus sp.]MDH4398584.1 type II secretion system protein GspM [Sphingorhabdus sp.]
MIESVRLWFAALTQREKWLVATAGILAGLSIAVFAIIMPALSVVEKAALDLDEAVQRRGRIVAKVASTQGQRSVAPMAAAADIGLLVTQSAAEKGFDVIKSTNAAPGQISIRIDQARAPAFLAWVNELEGQNIVVRTATLRSGANGTVTVEAQMQMGAQ